MKIPIVLNNRVFGIIFKTGDLNVWTLISISCPALNNKRYLTNTSRDTLRLNKRSWIYLYKRMQYCKSVHITNHILLNKSNNQRDKFSNPYIYLFNQKNLGFKVAGKLPSPNFWIRYKSIMLIRESKTDTGVHVIKSSIKHLSSPLLTQEFPRLTWNNIELKDFIKSFQRLYIYLCRSWYNNIVILTKHLLNLHHIVSWFVITH